MCNSCDLLLDAATEALERGVEAVVMLAEAKDGESVSHATRPLTRAEKRARVRFGALDRIENVSVADLEGILSGLGDRIRAEILLAAFGKNDTASPEAVSEAIAALSREQPAGVVSALEAAALAMSRVYERAATEIADETLSEARRQGRKGGKAARHPAKRFALAARIVAGVLWDRLTSQARTRLLDPATVAAGDPIDLKAAAETLAAVTEDGALDTARQTLHTVTADARNETAETLEPTEIWASELLDGATCQNCRAIDGKEYETMAEARKDYPNGPYFRCDGGARCRGTLVFIYPTGGKAPAEAPAFQPGD